MDILIVILLVVLIGCVVYILTTNRKGMGRAVEDVADRSEQVHKMQIEMLERQHRQQMEIMRSEYEKQQENLRRETKAQFENLAATVLKSNTDALKATNSEQIEAVLKPLKENIESFRVAVTDSYVKENASRQSLSDQITRLMKLNETIGNEARNLTSALKGNSKVQGDWGEMILETLLESAGLEKGINFEVQPTKDESGVTFKSADGNALRPDVIIRLPDDHCMIIDSKVSLTAFVDYCNADDETSRKEFGHRHLQSVVKHIDELSAKRYQDVVTGAADHVMMFIPNESAYIAAIQLDINLWKYAYDRRVLLVSPTHLFSSMSIVTQMWRQDKQNKNALMIAERGGRLYDKLVGFVESFTKIGKSLDEAQKCYDKSLKQLQDGKGNVIKQAEDLRNLGAKTTKSLPSSMLQVQNQAND